MFCAVFYYWIYSNVFKNTTYCYVYETVESKIVDRIFLRWIQTAATNYLPCGCLNAYGCDCSLVASPNTCKSGVLTPPPPPAFPSNYRKDVILDINHMVGICRKLHSPAVMSPWYKLFLSSYNTGAAGLNTNVDRNQCAYFEIRIWSTFYRYGKVQVFVLKHKHIHTYTLDVQVPPML